MKCATCGEMILAREDARVEWVIYSSNQLAEFKLTHKHTASPSKAQGCSWHALQSHDYYICEEDLNDFLGLENIRKLLTGEMPEDILGIFGQLLNDPEEDIRFRSALIIKSQDPEADNPEADNPEAEGIIKALAPPLDYIDLLEPFTADSDLNRGTVTPDKPIVCEILQDVTGTFFIAPEEDYRGGGMGSIQIFGQSTDLIKNTNCPVKVSGFYDRGIGLLMTKVVAA